MFMLNDKPLPLDTPFTVGEGDEAIQYPANWLRLSSAEEKTAIGITEVADPTVYDDRFYWDVDIAKDLADLKPVWIKQIKMTANSLMQPTDWMVLRQLFKGIPVPANVEAYRDAVVTESNRLESAIKACVDVPSLMEVVLNPGWPVNE